VNPIDTATNALNNRLSEEDKLAVEFMTALFTPKLTEVLDNEQIAGVLSGVMARTVVKMRNDMPVH
jgi:hypothetical protein